MRTNRHPGECAGCGVQVPADAGYLTKQGGGWAVLCRSVRCLDHAGLSEPKPGTRELTADGRVVMEYDPSALPLLRALPGAKFDRESRAWKVSLAPSDRPRLLELADRLGLEVAPELREVPEIPGLAEAVARAEASGAYPYQLDGVRWLAGHERALLGDDMGLGKTAQVLWSIPEGAGAVVVCPATLKHTWAAEIKKWRPDLQAFICTGRGSFVWPGEPGHVVITNYEILPTDPEHPAEIETILIADEAHRAKNHKAARTKRLRAISKLCTRTWLLTGTPLLNRPFDLWGVLEAGRMGKDVFGGFMGFLRSFGGYKNRWGGYEFDGPDASVAERLRRVMVRRTKGEVMPDLPSKRYETIAVELPKGLRRECDAWWDDGADTWRDTDEGLPDFREFAGLRAKLAKSRIKAATEYVEDCEEQDVPLLVFSAHREPVEKIGAREGWGMILGGTPMDERQRLVEAFQAGELKGLALTITAGGVGLTLTRASTVLFVDLDWTPGNNAQAEDRVARIGQTAELIRIVRMVSDHVLDRHVNGLLADKQEMIARAIEHVVEYEIPPEDTADVLDETEEEWQARVAEYQARRDRAELERAAQEAQGKIGRKVRDLVTRGRRLPESFDAEHAGALRAAVAELAARCDGARTKDGVGFNKPDAAIGAWLALEGMDDTKSLQLAWAIVQKYRGQMFEAFPMAFGPPEQMTV